MDRLHGARVVHGRAVHSNSPPFRLADALVRRASATPRRLEPELRDYLSTRRSEIEAQIKVLKSELAEIRIAEEAILESGAAVSAPAQKTKVRSGSIKNWVLVALEAHPNGLETDDVISAVALCGGPNVLRSSMSPQLSRLKAADLIVQDGRLWKIRPTSAVSDLRPALQEVRKDVLANPGRQSIFDRLREEASEPSIFDEEDGSNLIG